MSIRAALRRIGGGLMHPHPRFPFLAGHVLSPLDALAERIGMECCEALFAGQSAQRVADALVEWMDDAEALRALKKEYHRIYECRLRAVALAAEPTERHGMDHLDAGPLSGPLDAIAAADLRRHGGIVTIECRPRIGTVIAHWVSLAVAATVFLGAAVVLPLRHGRKRVDPVATRVAAPTIYAPSFWHCLQSAAETAGVWRAGNLLFVLGDRTRAPAYEAGRYPCLDPDTLPVPRGEWLRRLTWPGFRLVLRVLATAIANRGDPRVIELSARALNLAARSLNVWRLAFTLRCRWYVETEDSSSIHILRGIIHRKFGGGAIRWPYTQNEGPGAFLSYLGYDRFLSGGPFQADNYRQSWYPALENVAIGQIQNDRRLNADRAVSPEYHAAIETRLAAGQRMAVYFGGNLDVGFDRPMKDSLAALLAGIANQPGWFLVIKPKMRKGFYELLVDDARFAALTNADNVLQIRYPENGIEVCPAGWLIDRMSLGVTLPGSVQMEALTQGHPMMAYWPTVQDSPIRRLCQECGLLYDDPAELTRAIARFVAAPDDFHYPAEWFRDGFDPFADDRALERMAVALFGPDIPAAAGR